MTKRSIIKRTTIAAIALLAAAAIAYAFMPRPIEVDLATVRTAPLRVTVDEEGRTRIRERYIVSSPITGRLRRITLDPGDPVRANVTTLAVIEPTDPSLLDARALAEARARVRAAEAAVRQAQARLDAVRTEYDLAESERVRLEDAFGDGAANRAEIERARADALRLYEDSRAAQSGLEIAHHELEIARSAMLLTQQDPDNTETSRMTLTSPIDGVVLGVHQESVAVVTPGTPLLEIGDPSDLEIVADVLSADAVGIHPGQRVIIERWGGDHDLQGVVRLVEPSAFTKISALGIEEQRVNVIINITSPPDQRPTLGDGFRVETRIVTRERENILQAPSSALFRTGDDWAAYIAIDGRARLRIVETGMHNSTSTQILSGLDEGDQVVLYPSDRISHAARVRSRTDDHSPDVPAPRAPNTKETAGAHDTKP